MLLNFTELSHRHILQSNSSSYLTVTRHSLWNQFLVYALSIMITREISSSLQSLLTQKIPSQTHWLNHSERRAAPVPGLRSFQVFGIFQIRMISKWGKKKWYTIFRRGVWNIYLKTLKKHIFKEKWNDSKTEFGMTFIKKHQPGL